MASNIVVLPAPVFPHTKKMESSEVKFMVCFPIKGPIFVIDKISGFILCSCQTGPAARALRLGSYFAFCKKPFKKRFFFGPRFFFDRFFEF